MKHAWLVLALLAVQAPEQSSTKTENKPRGIKKLTPFLQCDFDRRQVALDAEVVLREGPLELFLCPKRSKEHESILAAEVQPRQFQLALLLIGAKPGRPAAFDNGFQPPTGDVIDIRVEYEVDNQKKTVDAKEWIRDAKTRKPMEAEFVFAGSRFQKVPGSDRPVWMGDDGDLICVSNFPGSVVDVAAKSSNADAERIFEAWTERIPPRGSKVRVYFTLKPERR